MTIFDNLYGKVFEKLVSRVFEMAEEIGMQIVVLTRDKDGNMQILANDEHTEIVGDIVSECMIRIVQAARDEEEARNATKQ